jgi:plasmid stability protein
MKAMTLTIELPEEQTAALAAKARALGISAEQYARQVLEHDLVPDWLQKSWASSKRSGLNEISMDEIDAEIAAARKMRREPPVQPGA